MIKMIIFSEQDYLKQITLGKNKECFEYREGIFEHLSDNRNFYRGIEEPPFRDKESIDFLKQLYDIEFVPNDWYSVYVEGGRCSVHTLARDVKYGLSVIDYSRNGYYLSYKPCHEKVWKFLADLPFDILLFTCVDKLSGHFELCGEEDVTILNYPYKGQEIEVIVKEFIHHNDEFYAFIDEGTAYRGDTSHGICIGADGKYYLSALDIGRNFQYNWERDVEGIIEYLDGVLKERHLRIERFFGYSYEMLKKLGLYREPKECSYLQFYKLIHPSGDYFSPSEYLYQLNRAKKDYRKSEITKEVYKEILRYLQQEDDYQEYLWLRDELKITNHMFTVPEETMFRKLGRMIIDKKHDGSYLIYKDVTIKYPKYIEEIDEILYDYKKVEKERVVLILNIEEIPYKREDFSDIWCGFRITENRIEAFDSNQALEVYLNALKEAYYSGNYVIGG